MREMIDLKGGFYAIGSQDAVRHEYARIIDENFEPGIVSPNLRGELPYGVEAGKIGKHKLDARILGRALNFLDDLQPASGIAPMHENMMSLLCELQRALHADAVGRACDENRFGVHVIPPPHAIRLEKWLQ